MKQFKLKKIAAALALAGATLFGYAHAAGLGKLTIQSGLGQPLRAEIDLTSVSRDEADSLAARLASPDAYRQAGVEYAASLRGTRMTVERRPDGQYFIRLASNQPVNDPIVDALIEITWANGRLVREYTFLLDSVDMRPAQPQPPAVELAPKPEPEPPRVESAPAPKPAAVAAPVRPAEPPKAAGIPGSYEVKKGDTLSKIARQVQADGVSLDQMMVALQQANQDAFVGGNINRLKSGVIINIPDKEAAAEVAPSDARRLIVAQSADWKAYQEKIAGGVQAAPVEKPEAPKQAAKGKITAKVGEKGAAAAGGDQLKLSKSDAAATAKPGVKPKATEEDRVAKERELRDAKTRQADLEKNVKDLQKLAEVKNQNLADLQKQAQAKAAQPQVAQGPVAVPPPAPAKAPEAPKAAEPTKDAEAPQAADAPKAPEAPKAAATEAPTAVPSAPAPKPEPSLVDEFLDNPAYLLGGGGVLALLGGYAAFAVRRKRKDASPGFENSIVTGGVSDADEVDPVAEADGYMAHGRDAQAEEILKEALQKDSSRQNVRLKLLEIYNQRGDAASFGATANELHAATGGQGEQWQKAAALGQQLDPANPLYGGTGAAVNAGGDSVSTVALGAGALAAAAAVASSSADKTVTLSAYGSAGSAPLAADDPMTKTVALGTMQGNAPVAIDLDFDPGGDDSQRAAASAIIDTDFAPGGRLIIDAPMAMDAIGMPPNDKTQELAAVKQENPDVGLPVDFDFDLGSDSAPAAAPAVAAAGGGGIDFDFDFGSLSLDLPAESASAAPDALGDDVATKLDLAKAYQEMGDKDGARELLKEVLAEGSEAQKGEAQKLIAALA